MQNIFKLRFAQVSSSPNSSCSLRSYVQHLTPLVETGGMGVGFSAPRTKSLAKFRANFDIDTVASQVGRVAVVTGANTGLGFYNAKELASKGMTVVMACRSEQRTLAAKCSIKQDFPEANLDYLHLDLSSLSSVREFSKVFRRKYGKLDVLINNAGTFRTPYYKTKDGFEGHMASNYFGHFLLTSLLLELMPNSPDSRVVSLSSRAANRGLRRVKFEDMHWEEGYNRAAAYNHSKLACLMFALELNRRLAASGKKIVSVAAHPGLSLTDGIGRHVLPSAIVSLLQATLAPFVSHAPSVASRSTLMAALYPLTKGGQYFGPQGWGGVRGPPGLTKVYDCAADEAAGRKLWNISVLLTGARQPFSGMKSS